MRPPDDQVLHVVMNGRIIGEIQRTGSRRMRLRYSAVTPPGFTPLSVTMPGPTGRYREKVLEPWLSGLLPDRPEMVRQWRRQFGITDTSVFTLLQRVGEDVAGAAQFVRPDRLHTVLARPGEVEPLDQSQVAEMLRRASWPNQKYESQGGPNAAVVAKLIRTTSHQPSHDLARFAAALIFNWLVCGTDAHARNYSLVLRAGSVRLAPLYDLNSHLAYSDGVGNHLSMSVNGVFEATRITVDDWVRFAPALYVEPEWLRAEIGRQRENLLVAMTKAATTSDVARYDSETVDRLLDNTQSWVTRVS